MNCKNLYSLQDTATDRTNPNAGLAKSNATEGDQTNPNGLVNPGLKTGNPEAQ